MKKVLSCLIVVLLVASAFTVISMNVGTASASLPDYTRTDIADAPKLPISVEETLNPEVHHSPWQIGQSAYWLVLDDYYGIYRVRSYTLKAIGNLTEIWVQDNLAWPSGDPRPTPTILPEQIDYLLNEFENKIYPTDTQYFGAPASRNGSQALLPSWLGLPLDYYYEGNDKNVILVSNIRDENYYDPTYPYYIAGFFSSAYDDVYFDRNIITIDSYQWERRIGPPGYEWIPGIPVTRPYVYESTIAHEYQHLIHHDWNPGDDTFMNEGCSMYAEYLCGYGIDPAYLNSYFATPDNSLTIWGDQGGINILADYGAAALWTVYLSDHYGGAATISYFVDNGVAGIDGINAALAHFGYRETFDDVYHDWRLANLIRSDFPGCHKYNYQSINLNDPSIDPVRQYKIGGLPVPLTKGTDFGNTITILGYDTGVSKLGPYGSDYITFENWSRPGVVYFYGDAYADVPGWTMTADGWWSGTAIDLQDASIVGSASVDPANPTLTIVTKYGIESYWDFGFVQISTDGNTWTSLANAYTTSDHDPSAHPAIVANLPGLTDYNPDWPSWTTMTFDLTAYAGETVQIRFRYMTDWATTYEGWWINSASVSGTPLTLAPVPYAASYQVTAVDAIVVCENTIYVPLDMWLNGKTQAGSLVAFARNPCYAILVVSPTMHRGMVDYKFRARALPMFGKWIE